MQHCSPVVTKILQPADERDANELKHSCHDNTQSYSIVCRDHMRYRLLNMEYVVFIVQVKRRPTKKSMGWRQRNGT